MKKYLKSLFAVPFFWIFTAEYTIARDTPPMTFNNAMTGGNCISCMWIAAQGVIEDDTHEVFRRFLEREGLTDAKGIDIHLHSPGGSLIGGILLGQAIREVGANTVVSKTVGELRPDGWIDIDWEKSAGGECSSACAYAFAGGASRYASVQTPRYLVGFQELGKIGVHQFYDPNALMAGETPTLTAADAARQQKLIATLLAYLDQMDVSAELLQLASSTDPDRMHYLTEDELLKTRMDNRMVREIFIRGYNNGVGITEIQYFRRDAEYRLELYCDGGRMRMLASIDWRTQYNPAWHRKWEIFKDLRLGEEIRLAPIETKFFTRPDGGTTGQFLFQFKGAPLDELVKIREFQFQDGSSRYHSNAAIDLSFTLPEDFDGLYLLPRTCLR